LPEGVTRVDPVQIPPNFDFTVEQFKREAGRRAGAGGLSEVSESMSLTRKVQKTAAEVERESMRGDTVSSASVDRFTNPWGEVFMQLWEDLRRLNVALPKVTNKQFKGRMDVKVYQYPVLIVSAASAKTLNPDLQFQRDVSIYNFAQESLAPMGVVIDADRAGREILSHADPLKVDWIVDPRKAGPGQQQPVYQALGELKMALQQIGQMVAAMKQGIEATAALAQEDAKRIDQLEGQRTGV